MSLPVEKFSRAEEKLAVMELTFAKRGLVIALISAGLWGLYAVIISFAYGMNPLNKEGISLMTIPVVVGALHEIAAFLIFLLRNGMSGKLSEYLRTLKTVPGKLVCIGGIIGGPGALTCSMAGILFAGPAYALAITGLYPVMGAILAVIFLKEKTNKRFWIGITLCVIGGVVLGFEPPKGDAYPHFYLGIILSLLAAVGWGLEGTIGAFGTDTIDPNVSVGLRSLASSTVFLIMVPMFGGFGMFVDAIFVHPAAAGIVALAALAGSQSLWYWYVAFGMTGVGRAMAMNSTYSLWGVVFTVILSSFGLMTFVLTKNLAAGVALMVVGIILVVINPKDLIKLRNN